MPRPHNDQLEFAGIAKITMGGDIIFPFPEHVRFIDFICHDL